MGGDYQRLYDMIREFSPKLENDRPMAEDIQRVTGLLQSEEAQKSLGLDKNHDRD
jgi:histidine ammonia-lyase